MTLTFGKMQKIKVNCGLKGLRMAQQVLEAYLSNLIPSAGKTVSEIRSGWEEPVYSGGTVHHIGDLPTSEPGRIEAVPG